MEIKLLVQNCAPKKIHYTSADSEIFSENTANTATENFSISIDGEFLDHLQSKHKQIVFSPEFEIF